MGESVPVGYRFQPTDEELVGYYLKYKLVGDDSRVKNIIADVDLCKFEPWDLPAFSKVKSDDPEWFFFSPRDLKYPNSVRSNRKTKAGYWKVTGADRNIKARGTNNVIGTKKTLVFYQGRLPGVKTKWVIHEYHAVTFPDDKRTFVLCRLMQKAEKKAKSRTDELINEEEPITTDNENQETADRIPDVYTLPEENLDTIFLEPHQVDEYDFPTLQHSPIVFEQELQEPYFQDSTFTDNDYYGNENNLLQFALDTTEEEDNVDMFLNSILVDEDVFISEERRHALVNDFTPSTSLRKVYYESSDTDAELASTQYGNILDTTSACNEHAVSTKYQVMKMVKTSQDAVYANPPALSSKTEVNREKEDSTFGDSFLGVDTCGDSSDTCGDSSVNKPMYVMTISSSLPAMASFPSTSRRGKTKHQPRSDNSVSQRDAPRRLQTQRKGSSKVVSQHEAPKETHILESNKDQRKAQNARSRKNLETARNKSSSINAKDSFIYLETPSVCQNPNPHSVYLINVVIGFLLLIATIWDMISFGKCY